MGAGASSLEWTRTPTSITRRSWTRGAGYWGQPPSRPEREGYEQLIAWVAGHGVIDRVGVESTGSFAAGLVRTLQERAIVTVEVNQPHAHTRHRRGKSDPIDAELAARAVLSAVACAIPKHTAGIVEAIRQLSVTRDSAVKARSAALNQLENLITAPDEFRAALTQRKTLPGKATLCLKLRPDLTRLREPAQAAKLALRSLARRIRDLDLEITNSTASSSKLTRTAAPRTTRLLGVGSVHTSQLLVTAGHNIDRLRGEAAFARICAAAPIPASSGRTIRHRLDRGGDHQANKTLTADSATAPAPAPTPPAAPPRASPNATSSAASSATLPASSTTPSTQISRLSTPLRLR